MAVGDSSFPTGQQRTGIVNSPHEERACRGSESLLGEKHQKDASGLQVALGLEQWKAACHGTGARSRAPGSRARRTRSSQPAPQRELEMRKGKWDFLRAHVHARVVGDGCSRQVGCWERAGEMLWLLLEEEWGQESRAVLCCPQPILSQCFFQPRSQTLLLYHLTLFKPRSHRPPPEKMLNILSSR